MPRSTAGARYVVRDLTSALGFTPGVTFGQITANTALNTLGNGADFWVFTEFLSPRNTTGGLLRLIGKADSGAAKYPFALRIANSGVLEQVIYNGTVSVVKLSANRLDDGQWHRVLAYFRQTASSLTLYIDGVSEGSQAGAVAGADQSNTGDIYIGRRSSESPSWRGAIQKIAIGIGSLSADDITNINYGIRFPATGTLLVNIDNNDGSGNTAVDASGNGNNAALTSPVWATQPITKKRLVRT